MDFKIFCLKITDTQRRGRPPQSGRILFLFPFLCKPVVRLLREGATQRPQHWCIWTLTLKESEEAFFQGILALPHFTKHTANSLPLPPSLSNPRGHREPLPHIKFLSSLSHSDLLVTSLQGSLF